MSADSGDLALAARVELVRGAIWQARGFGRPAVAHFQRALDMAQRIGSRRLVADTYAALASAHGDLGQWDRVLDFAERLHEADNRQSPATDFRYFFQRGVAFAEFHDREQATASLERALAAARALGDDRSISMALGELAATALDFDHDVKRALNTYDEALTTARRAASRDLEATWLLNSGAALKESGDFAGARPRFEQAIAVERASGARRVTPAALKNLAQVLLKNGDRAHAKAALAAARREADEQNLSELRWEVRVEEAALAREETPDAAEGLFRDALDILEDTQGSVLVEQLRTGAWTRALASVDPYDLMIDFLLARGRASDAFFVAERGRARAFLETLRAASDEIARALPPEYVEAEAALLADISEGQAALRSARLTKEERRALDQAIRSDEDQLSTLRLRLASDRPAVAAIRYPELWHAEDLGTKVLKPNQALVMFFLGAKNSTMWVVDREAVRVVRLPPRADIDRTARQYLEAAKQPHDPQEPARAAELFRLLFPELSVRSGVDELIVVPDGILHDLPFEALRDQQGQRLIERFSVAYAPSASSFALLAARSSEPRPSSTLLAIGNPVMSGRGAGAVREGGVENLGLLKSLPFTGAEMRDIARLYGPSAKVLEGTNASEPALRDADLSAVSILHFATHGIIDEDRPERSGLVLTVTPPSDDGVLQMREVYDVRAPRRARYVVGL